MRKTCCLPAVTLILPLVWSLTGLSMLLAGEQANGPTDAAPADAWPMFRGSSSGSGRSAASLLPPLIEHWRRTIADAAFEAAPVIADGTIYIGDLDGTFHALALDTGATRWTFRSSAGFPGAAAISAGDPRRVVVGDADGLVRALDATTGTLLWEYRTDGEISGGPTIVGSDADGRVLVGSQDASLACLDLADGSLRWRLVTADQIRCSPTIAAGRACVAGCDGKLHLIEIASGEEKAAVPIDGPTGTTPAADDGRVFFGTEGGAFFAIDVTRAAVAWRAEPAANAMAYRSSAAIAGPAAVVGSRRKAVEAFSTADGKRLWRRPMRGRVDGSPVVVGPRAGRLLAIVGDTAGRIVALDTADGSVAWEFEAGDGFASSPAVAAGRLVMASEHGTIWCFREPPQTEPSAP
jgi:outer membrane protein assembly factor BamB